MAKNRTISLTELHKMSVLEIVRQTPTIVTFHQEKVFAIVDVTPKIEAEIKALEAQQAKG